MKKQFWFLILPANCVSIYGVLFWNWNMGNILLFYWVELLVISMYFLAKIAAIGIHTKQYKEILSHVVSAAIITCSFLMIFLGVIFGVFESWTPNEKILPQSFFVPVFSLFMIVYGIDFVFKIIQKKHHRYTGVKNFYENKVINHLIVLMVIPFTLMGIAIGLGYIFPDPSKPVFITWIIGALFAQYFGLRKYLNT